MLSLLRDAEQQLHTALKFSPVFEAPHATTICSGRLASARAARMLVQTNAERLELRTGSKVQMHERLSVLMIVVVSIMS